DALPICEVEQAQLFVRVHEQRVVLDAHLVHLGVLLRQVDVTERRVCRNRWRVAVGYCCRPWVAGSRALVGRRGSRDHADRVLIELANDGVATCRTWFVNARMSLRSRASN